MCVLVVKNDNASKPLWSKSRIVFLGNFKDRLYQKSQQYTPVLKYSSLRFITAKAVRKKCILKQGDCNNAFCNATFPDDEFAMIIPPIGDPKFQYDE